MTKLKKNEITTTTTTTTTTALPEHLKNMKGRGSEQVDRDDLIIPRIEIAQSLSKVRKKNSSAYIEGADEGMLYNSVTRELYGHEVQIIPVFFTKEYLVWREQALGGGFGGGFETLESAEEAIQNMEIPKEWSAVLTHQHFCILIKSDESFEEVVISMAKSKLKVSKKLNSLVRINGGDRFSRVYIIAGITDENQKGQEFYNLDVRNVGYVSKEMYLHAEKVYELVKSGSVSADRNYDEMDDDNEY